MKKKLLSLLLVVMVLILTGCQKKSEENSAESMNVGCLKGPTAIGMVNMFDKSDNGETDITYDYTIAGTADELTTGLIKGDLDVAAVPCNLASILYNKSEGEIVTVAINNLGVLYIVETGDTVNSVNDLAGKTIITTGEGTTPEYTLRYLLTENDIDPDSDVTIEFKSEAAEVVTALTENPDAIAMLPEPYVTTALAKIDGLHIALDVSEEWDAKNDSSIVTGVIVARKSFIEENKAAYEAFMSDYKFSCEAANSDCETTGSLVEKYIGLKAAMAQKAIPGCNIKYIDGDEMVSDVLGYLNILYSQNPQSVGGSEPTEDMFYLE